MLLVVAWIQGVLRSGWRSGTEHIDSGSKSLPLRVQLDIPSTKLLAEGMNPSPQESYGYDNLGDWKPLADKSERLRLHAGEIHGITSTACASTRLPGTGTASRMALPWEY